MSQNFDDFKFGELTHLQVGRIGEYWVKLWLTLSGFETYYNDVDDRGIDFILRLDNDKHIDIQVKTVRKTNYVFVTKETWKKTLRGNLYLALVLLVDHEMPTIYMIPSTAWNEPNELLKDKLYNKEGQKSSPEWGINISSKTRYLLEQYDITNFVKKYKQEIPTALISIADNNNDSQQDL